MPERVGDVTASTRQSDVREGHLDLALDASDGDRFRHAVPHRQWESSLPTSKNDTVTSRRATLSTWINFRKNKKTTCSQLGASPWDVHGRCGNSYLNVSMNEPPEQGKNPSPFHLFPGSNSLRGPIAKTQDSCLNV